MSLELQGICPLIQVYDMSASIRFYCECLNSSWLRTRFLCGRGVSLGDAARSWRGVDAQHSV